MCVLHVFVYAYACLCFVICLRASAWSPGATAGTSTAHSGQRCPFRTSPTRTTPTASSPSVCGSSAPPVVSSATVAAEQTARSV